MANMETPHLVDVQRLREVKGSALELKRRWLPTGNDKAVSNRQLNITLGVSLFTILFGVITFGLAVAYVVANSVQGYPLVGYVQGFSLFDVLFKFDGPNAGLGNAVVGGIGFLNFMWVLSNVLLLTSKRPIAGLWWVPVVSVIVVVGIITGLVSLFGAFFSLGLAVITLPLLPALYVLSTIWHVRGSSIMPLVRFQRRRL
jgi:hypothetical protein